MIEMCLFSASYKELCNELNNSNQSVDLLTDFIKSKNSSLSVKEFEYVKKSIQKCFIGHFNTRWEESHKLRTYFMKKNEKWLQCVFQVSSLDFDDAGCSKKKGRPAKEFSRKFSRTSTNTDVFHRLFATSDPYISSIRRQPCKKNLELDDVVKEMIAE